MDVRYRPMQSKDIPKCAEHVAAHPVLGPRYGKVIEHLPSAIRRALRGDNFFKVFEEFSGSTTRLLGAGMAVFVGDDFLRQAKTAPDFWIGPELAKRISGGKSPLLTDDEVRDANSTTGLNLIVWHNTCHPQDVMRPEVATTVMTAFLEAYRGFRLREVVTQADSLEQMWGHRNGGGLYFDRLKGSYGPFPEVDSSNFSDQPRNAGITRELALKHAVSWLSSIFICGSPQFGFSRGEQRLLHSALTDGKTDEGLSEDLGISLSAVKQTWRSIYSRVGVNMPELVPNNSSAGTETQGRGKQKKQHLLAYLREHPEELRPVSRKLLRGSAGTRPSSELHDYR